MKYMYNLKTLDNIENSISKNMQSHRNIHVYPFAFKGMQIPVKVLTTNLRY